MERVNKLITDEEYIRLSESIELAERKRKFCRHGLTHSLDVARICYILNLEENLGIKKMLYMHVPWFMISVERSSMKAVCRTMRPEALLHADFLKERALR